MTYLITGVAGFIGMNLALKLLKKNYKVIGIDNLNHYYDINLKKKRLKQLNNFKKFTFFKIDLNNKIKINNFFKRNKIHTVINLAAQAGVRYSLENPEAYITTNVNGFFNLIECCKNYKIKSLLYASSSSVYGGNKKLPFRESDKINKPISLYAATKISNELIAETYSHLYNLNCIGLRFFTVYGPWGRPDMALFKFTNLILKNKKIHVYNRGKMLRDFTYIDDITESIYRLLKIENNNNHKIFNIGNNSPVKLMDFISELEKQLARKIKCKFMPLQQGDVVSTYSDSTRLEKLTKFKPKTKISYGIRQFLNWYMDYYKK